jgi:hypothetical protein
VLWRLVDWTCFGFLAVVLPRAYAGWSWAAAAGAVVTPTLAWWLRRILARTPPALRTTMWRAARRRRPAFAFGVAGLIACGLGIVTAAFLPDMVAILVLPAMVYFVVVLFRVRNRLIRVVLRRIRWLWYRVGRHH